MTPGDITTIVGFSLGLRGARNGKLHSPRSHSRLLLSCVSLTTPDDDEKYDDCADAGDDANRGYVHVEFLSQCELVLPCKIQVAPLTVGREGRTVAHADDSGRHHYNRWFLAWPARSPQREVTFPEEPFAPPTQLRFSYDVRR